MKLDVVLACISYIYIIPISRCLNHINPQIIRQCFAGQHTSRGSALAAVEEQVRFLYVDLTRGLRPGVSIPHLECNDLKNRFPKKTNSMIFPTKKSRFPVLQWSIDSTKNPSRFHPIPSKVSPWVDFLFKSWDHFGWLQSRISSRFSLGAFHGKWTPKPPAGYDNSTTPAGDSNDSVTKKDKWN